MLDPKQLRDFVIYPVLDTLALHKNDDERESAMQLLLGTAMQESKLTYLHQLGGGPALGLWQMEPATKDDILRWIKWEETNPAHSHLHETISELIGSLPLVDDLVGNLYYACAMCRVHYYRVPEKLPRAYDFVGHAEYWKKYYNTPLGAGTISQYLENWGVVERALA